MKKQHTVDLLLDKVKSCFVALIDNNDDLNIEPFWKCLIGIHNKKQPCIVITAGIYCYNIFDNGVATILNVSDYENIQLLFNDIPKVICSLLEKHPHFSFIYIFVESLSSLILDCPKNFEFENWVQYVIGLLFNLSIQENVLRMVCMYKSIHDCLGNLMDCSNVVINMLQQVATSFVRCTKSDKSFFLSNNKCAQLVNVWHRRSLQGEFSKDVDKLFSYNKPPFFEQGLIEFDLNNFSIVSFVPVENSSNIVEEESSDVLPQSTFSLSMTESEKVAKNLLVLPQDKVREQYGGDVTLPTNVEDGIIHYIPDCFDDLDDEDPDDDLDV